MWLHSQLRAQACLAQGPKKLSWADGLSGDPLARSHMIQQISVAVQRGNAASVFGAFEHGNPLVNYNYNFISICTIAVIVTVLGSLYCHYTSSRTFLLAHCIYSPLYSPQLVSQISNFKLFILQVIFPMQYPPSTAPSS